jgi:hypothetical protein
MANSNYGVILSRETVTPGVYATVGSASSVDLPKYITDALESTNHASGGLKTFIASGLKGIDAFSATYICDASLITLIKTDMRAKTISNFQLTGVGDFTTITFQAFFKSFQILGADATSPDVIKATIEIQPTGSLTTA